MMFKNTSRLAAPMVVALFLTTLCATGAMTFYRVSSRPVDIVIPARADEVPAVAPRPEPNFQPPVATKADPTSDPERMAYTGRERMAYQVRLASDGLLPGRLNVIDPVTGEKAPAERVMLNVIQHGKVVTSVKPGAQGIFQVPGLQPGVYSIVVVGEHGLLAYAVHVLPPTKDPDFQTESSLLQIDTSMVLERDFSTTRQVLNVYGTAYSLAEAETGQADELQPVAKRDDCGLPPLAETPVRKHLATILPDGRVVGRLWTLDPRTTEASPVDEGTVFFIRDGLLAGQVDVDECGTFAIRGLRAGTYSVIAAGNDGYAVFGVQLQEASPSIETVPQDPEDTEFVSTANVKFARELAQGIEVALTSLNDLEAGRLISNRFSLGALPLCFETLGGGGASGGGGGGWFIPPFYYDDPDDPGLKSPFDPFFPTDN